MYLSALPNRMLSFRAMAWPLMLEYSPRKFSARAMLNEVDMQRMLTHPSGEESPAPSRLISFSDPPRAGASSSRKPLLDLLRATLGREGTSLPTDGRCVCSDCRSGPSISTQDDSCVKICSTGSIAGDAIFWRFMECSDPPDRREMILDALCTALLGSPMSSSAC